MAKKTKIPRLYEDHAFNRYLVDLFASKKNVNSAYSIRAFASLLNVDQSFLSKVLKGNALFSPERMSSVLTHLGVPTEEFEALLSESSDRTDRIYFKNIESKIHNLQDWKYFAVLELFTLKRFIVSDENIAKKMGISREEAAEILERLVQLKFIELKRTGYVLKAKATVWSGINKTDEAKKNLQMKILQKSMEALQTIDVELRDHSSVTLALNKSQMKEFKETLKDVRRQLIEKFQKSGDFDEVYQISIGLFPLTETSVGVDS